MMSSQDWVCKRCKKIVKPWESHNHTNKKFAKLKSNDLKDKLNAQEKQ